MAKAKASAQIIVDTMTGELDVNTSSYAKFRTMRKQPTIALAREYSVAYILACSWSATGDNPMEKEYVEKALGPFRWHYLRTALFGESDFGWKAYEKVFDTRPVTFSDGTTQKLEVLDKLMPLKNDDTLARYNKSTGDFEGLSSVDLYTGQKIFIDAAHSLFVNYDDEGLGNYADGRMARIEATYDEWTTCNKGASEYDKKMAGTTVIIWAPVGETKYDGVMTDNFEIAKKLGEAMKSSGILIVPRDFADILEQGEDKSGWKIERMDADGQQTNFVDRLKYLDALMARGYAVPERAILEGEFGTKAEAGIHSSAALMNMDLRHIYLTEFFNWHVVNQMTLQNFDNENTTKFVAQPVNDDRRALFQALLDKLTADPAVLSEVLDTVDIEQVFDVLGIPRKEIPGSEAEIEPDDDDPNVTESLSTPGPTPSTNGLPRQVTVSMS